MREKLKNVEISDLRLWDENPRYSVASKINIENIGLKDFTIDDNEIVEDNYEENYFEYQKKLLNNIISIKATRELIESIANVGFRSAFDDMFITKPEEIFSYKSEFNTRFDYIDDIYYVVEGNRRLMCMDLLKNNHNSRKNIHGIIEMFKVSNDPNAKDIVNNLKAILDICIGYDSAPTLRSFIDCKEMDFKYYTSSDGATELNEILNSRHFGNRKGKLNWPRGLILKKVYSLVRREISLDPTLADTKNSKKLYKKIENYVGKKIGSSDIDSALFVNFAIEEWNQKNDEKIKWENTESGDIDQSINNIEYDKEGNEISSTEKTVTIFVSSLENARSNIKILDYKFNKTNLGRVLKLRYHFDKLSDSSDYITAEAVTDKETRNISQEDFIKIVLLIVKAVKDKKINTRSFANEDVPEVGIEIRKILFPNDNVPKDKILNWNLSAVMNIEQTGTDSESLAINDISRNLREIEKNFKESINKLNKENFKSKNDLFKKVFWYIWKTEYGRVVKFKDKTALRDVPTLIFSLLYRTTFEFIQHTVSMELAKQYLNYLINGGTFKPEYFDLLKRNFKRVNGIITRSFLTNNMAKNHGGDFKEIFDNESKENRVKMAQDMDEFFLFVLGLYDFSNEQSDDINFKYFGSYKMETIKEELFFNNEQNGAHYFPLGIDNVGSNSYKALKNECLNNNFFGKLDNKNQVIELFKIIENINAPIDSINGEKTILNLINRAIHKPLSSLITYDNKNSFNELDTFVKALRDTEESVRKILE